MSCDYAVWACEGPLSAREATRLYEALRAGTAPPPAPHPGVAAFYAELVARHPALEDVPPGQQGDKALCPWSCDFDRSEGHLILPCVWSRADPVGDLIESLAVKHGLAFYDPQEQRATYPQSMGTRSRWARW